MNPRSLRRIAALAALGLAGCRDTPPEPGAGPPAQAPLIASPAQRAPFEAIVSYMNPGVWEEESEWEEVEPDGKKAVDDPGRQAEAWIGEALDKAGIEWMAMGSANYTVSVPAYEAKRARDIVRETVAAHGLRAHLIEARD